MDFTATRFFQPHPNSSTFTTSLVNGEPPLERSNQSLYAKAQKNDATTRSIGKSNNNNPFAETFPDPLCKLNLKETSEFVKSFPTPENARALPMRREVGSVSSVSAAHKRLAAEQLAAAPPTPGRPVFGFSSSGSYHGNGGSSLQRKSVPSKWDDAEKWLMNSSSSCHESPAHSYSNNSVNGFKSSMEAFSEKSRVIEEKVSFKVVPSVVQNSSSSVRAFNGRVLGSSDVLIFKDKFTEQSIGNSGSKEAFVFETMRDAGTEMTPLGSSTTSLCQTPVMITSPARHNTPADRSGPLGGLPQSETAAIDIARFAKLQLADRYYDSNWSSREEEEEEISKSLRHFESDNNNNNFGYLSNVNHNHVSRIAAWEEDDKTKRCSRYQREEAKIQAWVNLQKAKAEAQSRKLEVKIEKMRSKLEEKLMKRMTVVHRKAEQWRESAMQQHSSDQMLKSNAHKLSNNVHFTNSNYYYNNSSCGCFPCNNNI